MSNESNPLGLYIPPQTIEFAKAPYIKPRDAERWIANLPTAHIGETARLIFKAMSEINRVEIPPHQRFKLLELFRQPFDYVTQALIKHIIGQAFPLSGKNQKISELIRELQWEIAIGYKIIINSSLSGHFGRVDKTLLTSINRALYYLGECLLKSYLVYTPQNNQTWIEIHHLYLFAEHNGLISESVKDNLFPENNNSTIGTQYKHIILLSLANPYRLPQSEIQKVNTALFGWSKYSHLHMLDDPNNPIGLFAIDLESNAPPSYYNTAQKQSNSNFIRILDTSELTRILRDQIETSEKKSGNQKGKMQNTLDVSQKTLKRLILAWGAVPKRNFSRKGKQTEVKVALGLSASHCFIQKAYEDKQRKVAPDNEFRDSEIEFDTKAVYQSDLIDNVGEPLSHPDVWDIAQNPTIQSKDELNFPAFTQFTNEGNSSPLLKTQNDIYDVYKCNLLNESAGGYCITWKNDIATKTVVGSLISLFNPEEEGQEEWSIGVIRWIKAIEKEYLYIGIELLSPSAQAIASKNITSQSKTFDYTRALLLPELRSVKQPQTLITQSLYHVGDKLALDVHGQSIKVTLTKLLENTSTFAQFEFSIIKTVKKPTPTDKNDRIKNFDSIWSSI